ncbi:DUF4259 domain-containing protein [Streptomyces canus]|uniref:DUF4259 domain-containing protein n=1 Tax=Streptomyces canus TaxID=58343 RepID=UPI00342F701A
MTRPWGTGPFDSDLAADFVDELEGLTSQKVIEVLERAFQRVTDSGARVDGGDGTKAVAAAALIASTIPGSGMVIDPDTDPENLCRSFRWLSARQPCSLCSVYSKTDRNS